MEQFSTFLSSLQDNIVDSLAKFEGSEGRQFVVNDWDSSKGNKIAYGRSYVLEGGKVFEKAGINYSNIRNSPVNEDLLRSMLKNLPIDIDEDKEYLFDVTGLSLVLHPLNPYCPTVHSNYRHFKLKNPATDEIVKSWYGGGCDMTPYYVFAEDIEHFHKCLKDVCDQYNPDLYNIFKKECDEYFYIKHRREHRGIGGIFFDYIRPTKDYDLEEFVKSCGLAFVKQYLPIIEKRQYTPYTDREIRWQHLRRSRYVEFNLIYDRGTKFGLHSPGINIENVLISLPPVCTWVYEYRPEKGSPEQELLDILKSPREWVS